MFHFDLSAYAVMPESKLTPALLPGETIKGQASLMVADKARNFGVWQAAIDGWVPQMQAAASIFTAYLGRKLAGRGAEPIMIYGSDRAPAQRYAFAPGPSGDDVFHTPLVVDYPAQEGLTPAMQIFVTSNPGFSVSDAQKASMTEDMKRRGFFIKAFITLTTQKPMLVPEDMPGVVTAFREFRENVVSLSGYKAVCFTLAVPQPVAFAFGRAFSEGAVPVFVGYDKPHGKYDAPDVVAADGLLVVVA